LGLLAVEVVLVALERAGKGVVLEAVGQFEPAPVTGVGVEVGKDLVHAAVLGVEHRGHLCIGHRP
jgi:hypothetical protein